MNTPESDADFRERLLRVVPERDQPLLEVLWGDKLDQIGRQYDRFRTGVPLKGLDGFKDDDFEDGA